MNIADKTKRWLLPVMLIMLTGVKAIADDVTFTAQAPQAVVAGERFRITYKVNTRVRFRITYKVNTRDVKEFRAPDMQSINILTGPRTSTSSSTQIINGKVTSSTTMTFTYVAVATEEGDITLDGATIKADGKQLTSNKLTITVLPPDSNSGQASGGQGSGSQQQRPSSSAQGSSAAGSDELFMLATVDKTTVYEQEALL